MKKLMLAVMTIVVSACGSDQADAFRKGIPQSGDVAMRVPGKGQALTAQGTRRDGLEGQTADFYRLTRDVTVLVNGGTAATLDLVHRVTQYPATTVSQDSAIWGPHTEPLSPNTWKLTVTRTAPDTYSYTLEGKGKTEADSAFRVVLSGTHVVMGDNLGTGSFLIDFDRAHTLPEHDTNVGTVAVTYARPTNEATTQIDADFTNVKDAAQLVDAKYRYWATPGQGGSLEFQLEKDFTQGPAIETGKIHSRWLETGDGRADVQLTGGDVTSPVTIHECWDGGFASRYLDASFDPSKNYGTESLCAFATTQYASL